MPLMSNVSPRMIRRFLLAMPFLASSWAFAAECSSRSPEAFNEFLARFSREQVFAVERTVFPLRILKWAYGLDEQGKDASSPVKSTLSREVDRQWPTREAHIRGQGLNQRVVSRSANAVIIEIFKEGSDWLTSYHFKNKAGCWYLWQFEDKSL